MQYEKIKMKLFTRKGAVLAVIMALGAMAFVARFALGLGVTTNLSDNYPWGLWIIFDLIWIALAAGAFVTAGIVYIARGEDFHSLARPAVWLGLLSYSFVTVTLLADLGLPWHFYQLVLQRPEHSPMYEVSWCIALYVTILPLEFAPAVFEYFGWDKEHKHQDLWSKLTPIYTVIALTLFVFLMSHKIWMAVMALVIFSTVAYLSRASYKQVGMPLILIVAAVSYSTMHQSSLGSLFLFMPDKLSPLWWSPIMSPLFFLSAVTSGLAVVIMMSLLVSYFYNRPYQWELLSKMGKILWVALIIYYGMRIVDVISRGKMGLAVVGMDGALFSLEILAGGLLPIALLSTNKLRSKKNLLVGSTILALGGVVLNRLNVVLFGMTLHGTQPGGLVGKYYPSLVEWAIVLSLIAGFFFFFGLGLKLLPVLPLVEGSNAYAPEPARAAVKSAKYERAPLFSPRLTPSPMMQDGGESVDEGTKEDE